MEINSVRNSVLGNFFTHWPEPRQKNSVLTLRELETFACTRAARLLTLSLTRVALETAAPLQRQAPVRVILFQSPRQTVSNSASLRFWATALHAGDHIKLLPKLQYLKRQEHRPDRTLIAAIVLEVPAIDFIEPGSTRNQPHSGCRCLAPPCRDDDLVICSSRRIDRLIFCRSSFLWHKR